MGYVVPLFTAPRPVAHVSLPLLPFDTVRIVINYSNAPRHNDVVTDHESPIADKIAAPNKRSASNANFAAIFFETNVGMNNRFISDPQTITCNSPDTPPRNCRPAAQGNRSRTPTTPAKNSVNYANN
jgi:hypothetical protein